MIQASQTKAWTKLLSSAERLRNNDLGSLFHNNEDRANQLCFAGDCWVFDYSKSLIDSQVLDELLELWDELGGSNRIEAMYRGDPINKTEQRSVRHVELRRPNPMPEVTQSLNSMADFCEQIKTKALLGASTQPITSIVNIGIGGSDLGPRFITEALSEFSDGTPEVRFVSNVDPADLDRTLEGLDPGTTMFIVASKSFNTTETMTNANSAREWIVDALGEGAIPLHFAAVTTAPQAATAFGVTDHNIFGFAEWVGGRYSVCSSVGLSVMAAVGSKRFTEMLSGMAEVDQLFTNPDPLGNPALLFGLISVWNRNLLGINNEAVIPYSALLNRFPHYVQQLEMESNGKSVQLDGQPTDLDTCGIVWGAPGTDCQHAFMQLLHQGTVNSASEFIGFASSNNAQRSTAQDQLVANMFAQSRALAFGNHPGDPHKVVAGNKPSVTLLFDRLTPMNIGRLIALYEHKVFTQGVIWGINSFDQFGVQLGKVLSSELVDQFRSPQETTADLDASTKLLVDFFKRHRS